MFGDIGNPLLFIFSVIALLLAIDVHEFAHAWAAEHLGDPTPRLMGRLTLNPLAHLDPIGTLMILFVHFGWGKPVQFDPYNLRSPRRDSALISLAGPTANICLAIIASILFHFVPFILLEELIIVNCALAVFNLIPIHPLDGFSIVEGILPPQQAAEWHELERYGIMFLIVLLFPIFGGIAPIQRIISPIISALLSLLIR